MISCENLSFAYHKTPILDQINLHIPEGSIFGIIGINGAGKTTLLKLILDLLTPKSGSIKVFNEHLQTKHYKSIGALIEHPVIYNQLTAYEHLLYWCKLHHIEPKRIDVALEQVGLLESSAIKAKEFSLGMKQRLGLATALVHQPKLLILDEPLNGLDPLGIIELRNLFLELHHQGTTLVLTSHLLAELEKISTHVAIIDHSTIKLSGAIATIINKKEPHVVLESSNPNLSVEVLRNLGLQPTYTLQTNEIQVKLNESVSLQRVLHAFLQHEIELYHIQTNASYLEHLL